MRDKAHESLFEEINHLAVRYYTSEPEGVSPEEAWIEAAYHRGFLARNPIPESIEEARKVITQLGSDLMDWPVHAAAMIKQHLNALPRPKDAAWKLNMVRSVELVRLPGLIRIYRIDYPQTAAFLANIPITLASLVNPFSILTQNLRPLNRFDGILKPAGLIISVRLLHAS